MYRNIVKEWAAHEFGLGQERLVWKAEKEARLCFPLRLPAGA